MRGFVLFLYWHRFLSCPLPPQSLNFRIPEVGLLLCLVLRIFVEL